VTSATIRSALPNEQQALTTMLDHAFNKQIADDRFANRYPHLFTDRRIVEHTLACDDKVIIGCVGCYQFSATLNGTPLTIAGIGQVGTAPEARNRGIMSAMLSAAMASAEQADLFYLYGDRTRYGRVGFAPGGQTFCAMTWERYAPAPGPGPDIRAINLERDSQLIEQAFSLSSLVIHQDPSERWSNLSGKKVTGWTDGTALILVSSDDSRVLVTMGSPEGIARLIRHQVAKRVAINPKDSGVTILADPRDVVALAVARLLGGSFSTRPTAMLRVGKLHSLLTAWANGVRPQPGALLAPCVLDGGAAGRVRITVGNNRYQITPTTDHSDVALDGAALAEVVFGTIPLAVSLPQVPSDSALLGLLPILFNINECYGL